MEKTDSVSSTARGEVIDFSRVAPGLPHDMEDFGA